jgi:ABC-type multidrug transport system fused ATPase/permease subunit
MEKTANWENSTYLGRYQKTILGLCIFAILLLALRLALPTIVEHYVNRQLQHLNGYTGHVGSIHIALWRGAYVIEDIIIEKKSAKNNEPFLDASQLQLAVQWRALLHGSVVGHAHFNHAQLNLVQSENRSQQQLGNDNDWNAALEKLFPFTFNEISGDNCVIRFRAPGIERKEAMVLHDLHFSLRNLTNAFPADDESAFASFDVNGHALGKGELQINGKLNPRAKAPTFEVAAELKQVSVPELNPWLDNYAGVNAEAGLFSVYTEFAAAEGKFKGYVKPIVKDLNVTTPPEKKGNIFRQAWTGLVQLAATLFKNQPHDQLATRVPFSGSIENPDTNVWITVVNILRNAFINAFSNSLEHSVNLHAIAGDKNSDKESDSASTNLSEKDK